MNQNLTTKDANEKSISIKGFQLYLKRSKHHQKVFEYFSFDNLDAFHNQDILSVVYGHEWYSVLITDTNKALLHTFSKQKIRDTDWFDIEPFIGYAGPVTNTTDKTFIRKALEVYSAFCKEERIIAEIIRFNCILNNHISFENNPILSVFPAKEIVVVNCIKDKALQLRQFSEPCRRRIKIGQKKCHFRLINKFENWDKFLNFYFNSLKRVCAQKSWYFSRDFFERARQSEFFNVCAVWYHNEFASASLVVEHPLAAYYLLAGNSDALIPGASELLIFGIAQAMANKNIPHLILGGGNSPAPDDPLLRFKKKFANTTQTFFMGKMIHNSDIFQKFCDNAVKTNPGIERANFFLKYRLVIKD